MQFETTVELDAKPQDVWAALVDVERWPEWTDSMNEVRWLDDAAVRVGSQARIKQPSTPTMTWTVTELDAGRALHWQASGPGVKTLGTHVIAAAGDGRSTLTLGLRQSGGRARVLDALIGSRSRRFVQMEAEGCKRAAETAGHTGTPASAA